jgi:hypothetical protein
MTHLFLLQLVNFHHSNQNKSVLTWQQEALVASLMTRVYPIQYQRGFYSFDLQQQALLTTLILGFQQIFGQLISDRDLKEILKLSNELLEKYGRQVYQNPTYEFQVLMKDLKPIKLPKRFCFSSEVFNNDAKDYSEYLSYQRFPLLQQMSNLYQQSWQEINSGEFYQEIIQTFVY